MSFLERLFTEMQVRFFLVDAYLAELRNDRVEASRCKGVAYSLRQQIALDRMEIGL